MALLLTAFSCVDKRTISIKPQDSSINELYFEYWSEGKYKPAFGIASDIFRAGAKKMVRVVPPPGTDGKIIVTDSGDVHKTVSFDGSKAVEIPLGTYPDNRRNNTIGIVLVTTDKREILGTLHDIGNLNVTRALPVKFMCPYQLMNGSVSACIRPYGYSMYVTVYIDNPAEGLMRVKAVGACQEDKETHELGGTDRIVIRVRSNRVGDCNIRFDTRQDKVNGVWRIQKFHEINVNYYEPRYIPLGVPLLRKDGANWKIVATDTYDSYYVNGTYGGKLEEKQEVSVDSSDLVFVAWDKFGRVTWANSWYSGLMASLNYSHNYHEFKKDVMNILDEEERKSGLSYILEALDADSNLELADKILNSEEIRKKLEVIYE